MFIECKNLYFSYNEQSPVLKNIHFSLEKGKTLAIVGASGCGKSTLLRIISGLLPNSIGNSLLGKLEVGGLTPDLYRQTGKLAFMFQEATLMPHLNVKENIKLPLNIKGTLDLQRVGDLIKAVGLEEYINYLPKQLSGGMKTRVALARSFSTMPELLLLDEPFSALDIAWKSKLYIELERLREATKTTLIVVTHDVQEALLLADYVIVLDSLGQVEKEMEIKSNFSNMERVLNMTEYMNSVYEKYLLPMQSAIINGQKRLEMAKASKPLQMRPF